MIGGSGSSMNRLIVAGIGLMFMARLCPLTAQVQIYGMTAASSGSTAAGLSLVHFPSNAPGSITTVGSFTGMLPGHALRTIDFRPATGQLYAMSQSTSTMTTVQLYTVNLDTAALTPVGSTITLTGSTSTRIELEFNPVTDIAHVFSGGAAGNNHTVNPVTGALLGTHTNLVYAAGDPNQTQIPSIVGAAFSNNTVGAASTTLYGWDYNNDALITIGGPAGVPAPASGNVFTVHEPAGSWTNGAGLGMDIGPQSNTLYVTHDDPNTGTTMSLFTRDLVSGAESLVGAFPSGTFVADVSVNPVPEPATYLATLFAVSLIIGKSVRKQRWAMKLRNIL